MSEQKPDEVMVPLFSGQSNWILDADGAVHHFTSRVDAEGKMIMTERHYPPVRAKRRSAK